MESLEDQLKDRHLVANKNESMQENIASLQIDLETKRKEIDDIYNKLNLSKKENEQLYLDIEELKFKLFESNRNIIDGNLNAENIQNKNQIKNENSILNIKPV